MKIESLIFSENHLRDAFYIPPTHEEVPELMGDLEKFLNNQAKSNIGKRIIATALKIKEFIVIPQAVTFYCDNFLKPKC